MYGMPVYNTMPMGPPMVPLQMGMAPGRPPMLPFQMGMAQGPLIAPDLLMNAFYACPSSGDEPVTPEPEPEKEQPTPEPKKRGIVKKQTPTYTCAACRDDQCDTAEVEQKDNGLQLLRMSLHRPDVAVPWGLELTAEDPTSLTVTQLQGPAPTRTWKIRRALGAVVANSLEIKVGDVLVGVANESGEWNRAKAGMVEALKGKVAVKCEFARSTEFVATLHKESAEEPLKIDVEQTADGQLIIRHVRSVQSAVTRYNEEFFQQPLLPGDKIIAVNGRTDTMVADMQADKVLKLSVRR